MTDHLSIWHCPECGSPEYHWHFEAPDGVTLSAKLPVIPDMSGLEAAKAKALTEHEQSKVTYELG